MARAMLSVDAIARTLHGSLIGVPWESVPESDRAVFRAAVVHLIKEHKLMAQPGGTQSPVITVGRSSVEDGEE